MNGFARTSAFLLIYCFCAGLLSGGFISGENRCLGQKPEKVLVDSKADWKALQGKWAVCQFGGEGEVGIRGNRITIASGQPLTGVFWDENLDEKLDQESGDGKAQAKQSSPVRDCYELKLTARRTDGFDFFCGLTFPIADQHATLVLGGWGGGITGLSCIDGLDASENDTNSYREFEDQRWYRVRVRVDPDQVQCWVDDESVAKVSRLDHAFSLRTEMDLCEPLGIAAYECDAEYKDIVIRQLSNLECKKPPLIKAVR